MENNHKSSNKLSRAVTIALGLATGASVSAWTYTAALDGASVDHLSHVTGIGVASSPQPPLYQDPRLVPYGGSGWASQLTIVIDSTTGELIDFKETYTEGFEYGSGGPAAFLYTQGSHWSAGPTFGAGCRVTSANPGETGAIVYECPEIIDHAGIAVLDAAGFQCMTPQPSSTNFISENGCGTANAGASFPGGNPPLNPVFHSPEITQGAHIARPANSNFGIAGPTNPAYYSTNDRQQKYNGISVDQAEKASFGGGTWTITHSGSFSNGDFQVTSVNTELIKHITVVDEPGQDPIRYWERWYGEFPSLQQQTFAPNLDDLGKNVPAIGTFGLASLLVGLIALVRRFMKSGPPKQLGNG